MANMKKNEKMAKINLKISNGKENFVANLKKKVQTEINSIENQKLKKTLLKLTNIR